MRQHRESIAFIDINLLFYIYFHKYGEFITIESCDSTMLRIGNSPPLRQTVLFNIVSGSLGINS